MRFSIFTTLLAATSAVAAPANGLLGLGGNGNKLSASDATSLIQSLNTALQSHAVNVNQTLAGLSASSAQGDKDDATKKVGAELQAMTVAITNTIGEIGLKANNANQARQNAGQATVEGLAQALKTTLITVASVVNTALAVLGLTPLLAFLTPLTGALSGLVQTLQAVVDQLLPILNTILDGVIQGLTGLLRGLIL